jgi:hypothetical protein
MKVLVAAAPAGIPRLGETRIDLAVLAFAVTAALVSSAVFGPRAALRASKQDVQSTLREGGRGAGGVRDRCARRSSSPSGARVHAARGAGLLVRSALYLQQVKPGFDPRVW